MTYACLGIVEPAVLAFHHEVAVRQLDLNHVSNFRSQRRHAPVINIQ